MEHIQHYTWLLVLIAVALVFLWHRWQHRRLIRAFKTNVSSTAKSALALAVDRAWQILFLGVLLAVFCFYYARLTDQQSARIAAQAEDLADLRSQLETAIANASAPRTAVFQPSLPQSESMQENLDDLKARYEELFVNYYYLKRCNLISVSAFHVMNSSLLYELSLMDAPAGIRNSILQAARGTHDEMYANASCDENATTPMLTNVRRYLAEVIKNVSD